ncbi:MAG: cyclic nucleotide-binding domain-containing protein [Pseudomonadota bacterium]
MSGQVEIEATGTAVADPTATVSAFSDGVMVTLAQAASQSATALQSAATFPGIAIHIASITLFLGYLLRDQIHLRLMVVAGQMLYGVFYLFQPSGPIWESIFWNTLLAAVNVVMVFVILHERTMIRLSDDEKKLMSHFDGLSAGELRRVLKGAEWVTVADETRIITHGQAPDSVYFILEGRARIERADRSFDVTQGVFLGEVSHLLQRPATATVVLTPGTRYLRWNGKELNRTMERSHAIDQAFRSLFNRDLAAKVAAG